MSDMDVKTYVFQKSDLVDGYIEAQDALTFATLLEHQTTAKIQGSLLEIGVFFGRSLFLLDILRQPGEDILAVDLFQNTDGSSRQPAIMSNAKILKRNINESNFLKADSTTLSASDISNRIGAPRFSHIDGGHDYETVLADANLCADAMQEAGIIVFDDFLNPTWPEVTAAAYTFFKERTDFRPFATTRNKLYACKRDFAESYAKTVRQSSYLRKLDMETVSFFGDQITHIRFDNKRRVLYEAMRRLKLRVFAARLF